MKQHCCPLCSSQKGIKHSCEVCKRQFCRACCKRFVSLQEDPSKQVRACNECFLKNVAWDPTRSYDVYGSEADKAVVLVHGALAGRQSLVLEAKALAEVGFRVVVPDLPAHGSRFAETPLTLDNAVATLHEVIQKEAQGQKIVMMGFGMGGYIAAAFAGRYPDSLAGVLLGGCCHDTHNVGSQLLHHVAGALYVMCSYRKRSQLVLQSSPEVLNPQHADVQECFLRAGCEVDALQDTWQVMYDADMRQLLPKITCPALLVVGEHEERDHEHKWLSKLQHGGLLVLKGGSQQFMFQPEVCHHFRMNAEGFAAAADWDPPERPSQPGSRSSLEVISTDAPSAVLSADSTDAPSVNPASSESKGNAGHSIPAELAGAEVEVRITLTTAAGALKGASKQQLLECLGAAQSLPKAQLSAGRAARRVTAPVRATHSVQLQQGVHGSTAEHTAVRAPARRTTSPALGRLSAGAGTASGVARSGFPAALPAQEKGGSRGIGSAVVGVLSHLMPTHKKDALEEPFSAASSESYDNMYKALRRRSMGT